MKEVSDTERMAFERTRTFVWSFRGCCWRHDSWDEFFRIICWRLMSSEIFRQIKVALMLNQSEKFYRFNELTQIRQTIIELYRKLQKDGNWWKKSLHLCTDFIPIIAQFIKLSLTFMHRVSCIESIKYLSRGRTCTATNTNLKEKLKQSWKMSGIKKPLFVMFCMKPLRK